MADNLAVLGVSVDSSAAVRGLNEVTRATGSMLDVIKQAAPAVAALFSTRAIVGIGGSLISAAAELQEASGVLSDVFGTNEQLMSRAGVAIQELADKYAYSTAGASQQISMTADTFHKFGVELEKSFDLSVDINKLGADLAAFTNYAGGSEGATRALSKALMGERESAKALGIVISEDAVKTQMERDAKNGLTYATQQQAKMMATLTLIQRQSTAAQGKAVKEADNYSTKMRNLQGKLTDLKAAFGEVIIDPFTSVISGITSAVDWLKGLDEGWRKAIVGSGLFIGAVTLVGGAIKTLSTIWGALTAARKIGNIAQAKSVAQAGKEAISTGTATTAVTAHTGAVTADTIAIKANTAAKKANAAADMFGGGGIGKGVTKGITKTGTKVASKAATGTAGKVAGSVGTSVAGEVVAKGVTKEIGKKISGKVLGKAIGKVIGGALAGAGVLAAIDLAVEGAKDHFVKGVELAKNDGGGKIRSVAAGVINTVTSGLIPAIDNIGESFVEFKSGKIDGFDASMKVATNAFDVLTLGISSYAAKCFQAWGVTEKLGNILAKVFNPGLVKESDELDEKREKVDARMEGVRQAHSLMEDGPYNYMETDDWQDFQAKQKRTQEAALLTGTKRAEADVQNADADLSEKQGAYDDKLEQYNEAQQKVNEAFAAMENAQKGINIFEARVDSAHRGLEENKKLYEQLQDDLIKKSAEYQEALGALDQLDTESIKKAAEDVTNAENKRYEALAKLNESKAADLAKERNEQQNREDAEISQRYTGITSDEGRAGQAEAEREMLSGRLEEMEQAADKVKEIEDKLNKADPTSKEAEGLRADLEIQKVIAGSLQDRLALQNQIIQKTNEEEEALSRVAEKEDELTRQRDERNKALAEQTRKLTDDYITKQMNDYEKLNMNIGKMGAAMEQAENIAFRQEQIDKMDMAIADLAETAKRGGDEGRQAEQEMNEIIKERARKEEELQNDKVKNIDEQFAALNAIDDIAGAKANEYTQKYQRQMEKWNEGEKNDRKPVNVQKAVDAASAEGFAQLGKIYDTSQRKIEDHTKNIKEYTRQMKQYLMQLAAQGNTTWALDVEGA